MDCLVELVDKRSKFPFVVIKDFTSL